MRGKWLAVGRWGEARRTQSTRVSTVQAKMIRARLLGVSRKRGRSIVPSFVRTFVLGFFEVGLPLRCEEDLKESYQPPRAQPASLSSPCLPPSPPPLFVASSVVSSLESAFLPSFLPSFVFRRRCVSNAFSAAAKNERLLLRRRSRSLASGCYVMAQAEIVVF